MPLALRAGRRPDLGPRRDGRRARLLRPDDDRRRRRHRHGHLARRARWSAATRWARRRSTSPTGSPTRRSARRPRRRSWSASRSSACSSCTGPTWTSRPPRTAPSASCRRAARPGVRRRVEHHPRQQGRDGLHRHAADRRRRAVRRRCDRPARRVPSRQARDRRPGRGAMARDLIPPSSPGRPARSPTGRRTWSSCRRSRRARPSEPPMQASRSGRRSSATASGSCSARWPGIFIAAALVFAVVLSTGATGRTSSEGSAPNWSAWQPTDTTIDGGAAADRREGRAEYRHPNGKQLVLVTGSPLEVPRRAAPAPRADQRSSTATGVLYQLNGLGPTTRSRAAAAEERLQVIQREALELALYTFRYLPDVEMVVTCCRRPRRPRSRRGRGQGAAGELAQAAVSRRGTGDARTRRGAGRDREAAKTRRHRARRTGARSSTAPATSSRSCRCRSA